MGNLLSIDEMISSFFRSRVVTAKWLTAAAKVWARRNFSRWTRFSWPRITFYKQTVANSPYTHFSVAVVSISAILVQLLRLIVNAMQKYNIHFLQWSIGQFIFMGHCILTGHLNHFENSHLLRSLSKKLSIDKTIFLTRIMARKGAVFN